MILNEIMGLAYDMARAEFSETHDYEVVRKHINEAQKILVAETGCLVAYPGDISMAQTQANGAVAADTALIVDSTKYIKVGDRLDIVTISGSSPSETYTEKSMNNRVASINHTTKTLTMATALTCADNDYVFWRNDIGLITTVADEPEYFLPWSCLEVLLLEYKHTSGGQYRPLRGTHVKKLVNSRALTYAYDADSTVSGWPGRWLKMDKWRFQLDPPPASAISQAVRIHYARKPNELLIPTDEPEVEETYHMALSHWAAYQMLLKDGEMDHAMAQLQMWQSYLGQAAQFMGMKPRPAMQRSEA